MVDTNRFLIALSDSERTSFGRVDFSEQPEEQQVFSAVYGMEGHVNDGGFAQDFASSDGDAANYAPAALRRIGATRCASLVDVCLSLASIAVAAITARRPSLWQPFLR